MDIFLIKDGVVENIASFNSIAEAQAFYPNHTVVEKTEANAYKPDGEAVNPGDPAP